MSIAEEMTKANAIAALCDLPKEAQLDVIWRVFGSDSPLLGMDHSIAIIEQRDLAVRRLLVIQQFLRNAVLAADGPFDDGYSGRMRRAKAEILAGEFNPDDFLGKEDDPT